MARTIATIQNQIIANVQSNSNLSGLNSVSNTAIWRLLTWVVAVAINLLEQLWDIFQSEIETTAADSITGNAAWLRQQVLNFQYDPTTPQVIQIDPTTFVPAYPVIDATKQIVSRCSVVQAANNVVNIKVATGEPPTQLNSSQQTSLQAYLNAINFAGVQFLLINLLPDLLYVNATVYYDGQYDSSIRTTVPAALNNYCATLSSATNFNGIIKASAIEDAILAVPGVKDVVLQNVSIRDNNIPWLSGTYIVQNYAEQFSNNAEYTTASGYVVGETTTGFTFTDQGINAIKYEVL